MFFNADLLTFINSSFIIVSKRRRIQIMNNISIAQMKAYLKLVMQMETDLYSSKLLVSKISSRIDTLKNQPYYTIDDYVEDTLETNKRINILKQIPWWVYLYFIFTIPSLGIAYTQSKTLFVAAFFVYLALFALLVIICLAKKRRRKKNQAILNAAYRKTFDDSKVKKEYNDLIIANYNVQLNEALNANSIAKNNLIRIYSENILPPAYRNFVAATTMYQWLEYGICTKIYGHGGLLDRYDSELKYGKIIGSLDEINSKLDDVVSNQSMLLDKIEYSNQIAEKTYQSVQNIEASNEKSLKNTANIEKNTNIIAMETRYQTRMQQYSYYQNLYY